MFSLIGFVMFLVGIVLIFKVVGTIAGLLLALLVAGVIGFGAEAIVPGDKMPRGWMAAIGAGLMGSWIGHVVLGHFGPRIAGFAIVPALAGAVLVVMLVTFLNRHSARS